MIRAAPAAIAVALSVAMVGCAPMPPAPPESDRIYDVSTGRAVTAEALIERLATVDFVLLGERHDNPAHHRLQAWITERLLERGRAYGVAFEMIDRSQTAKLAQYLAASPHDSEGLGPALDWPKSGWPPWPLYQPIAAAAVTRDMPILAANLPPDVARGVAKEGLAALPADVAQQLRLDPSQDVAVLEAHKTDIQRGHCGMLPERSLAPFALAQYARDAVMARVMADQWLRTNGRFGVVLIAGIGHVRSDRGVPLHLGRFAPKGKIIALGFVETDDKTVAPDVTGLPFDIVWFTSKAADEADPCAAFTAPR